MTLVAAVPGIDGVIQRSAREAKQLVFFEMVSCAMKPWSYRGLRFEGSFRHEAF